MANVYGNGNGMVDFAEDYVNGIPPKQRLTIGQAEARIAKLERALADMTKNKNGGLALAKAVVHALETNTPNHPLSQKKNRVKIYEANYRL